MVRTSLTAGLHTRGHGVSYAVSMRCNGLPDRQNVFRRVQISIMNRPARRAGPFPDLQRQRRDDMPAFGTRLGRWKPAVHADRVFPIPPGFFFKHPNSCAYAGVAQAAGKAVVFNHPSQIQILDTDDVKLTNNVCCQPVQTVLSAIPNFFMKTRNRTFCQLSTLGAFLLSRQSPLQHGKSPGTFMQMLRIGNALAVRECSKPGNAEVDTDSFPCLRHWLHFDIDHETCKVSAAGFPNNCQAGRMARQVAIPAKPQHAKLADMNPAPVTEPESGLSISRRGSGAFLLERWITGALGEERGKRGLKITKRLLCRNAGHFIEPRRLGLALQDCQRLVTLSVVHTLAVFERLRPRGKRPVVDITHASESTSKNVLLFWRRIKAVRPSLLHLLHITLTVCNVNVFRLTPELLSLPGMNAGASRRSL